MWRRQGWLLLTPRWQEDPEDVSPLPGGRQNTPEPSTARAGASPTMVGAGATHLSGHCPGRWLVTTHFHPRPQRPGWLDTASRLFCHRTRSSQRQRPGQEPRAVCVGSQRLLWLMVSRTSPVCPMLGMVRKQHLSQKALTQGGRASWSRVCGGRLLGHEETQGSPGPTWSGGRPPTCRGVRWGPSSHTPARG